jgi:acyl transferase domain-containing protein
MAMVELSFDAAQLALAGREDRLSIAVSNSPRATVISGDVAALDALLVELEGRGIFCRRIRVEVASHSAHVDELRADLMNALVDLEPRPTSVELYSTVTGGALDGARLGAEYWACNLRQPVLFSTAIRRLAADGLDAFIEMSSHPILLAAVQDSLQDAGSEGVLRLPSGRREEDEGVVMRESLATLWVQGYPLDWSRLLSTPSHTPTRVVSLPTYPWQRDRFWHEAAVTRTQPRTEEPLLTVTSGVDSARPRAGAMAELFHRVEWHPHARPRTSARPHGRWLIVADGEQPAAALVARLEAAGEECVVRSAVHALRRELGETLASEPPITGCVHLASVGIDPHASPTEGLAADNGWASALALVQAVVERAAPVAPRLWLVTRGAQRIGADDGPVSLGAAAEWGFGAAIGYEHPALHATRVDLAWHPGAMDMASLTEELLGADGEDQIALRGTTRYVARLIRQAPPDAPSDSQGTLISPEGSYLVTGGTGGIGLVLARWLVDCGARDLTLMGRRAPSPHVDRVVEELRSMGAEVSVARGDVTRREDVQRVVAESSRRRPLLGVIHAAGALDDGLLADLHHERFTRVLATKVDGAIHLGEATHNAALDFFVCFSSVVGVLGSPGVLNYAVANAALDAVATQSHRLRHPMLSVAWGPWNRLGMAGRRDAAQELGVLSVAEAIDALKRVLAVHATGLLVMRFDPARWSRVFPVGASSLLCELNAVAGPVAETTTALDRIRAAAPGERRALLEGHLREHVAHALRVAVSHVDRSVLLKDLGLNSLLSLELRNRLETSLGIILPATLVWNYPTVAALAAHLEERLELAAPAVAPEAAELAEAPELERLLTEIQGLSDDEVHRLLAEGKAGTHRE